MSKLDETNPVIYVYRGVEIRKYPMVYLRVDPLTMQDIIDARLDTNLSDREILGHSSKPCSCCVNKGVRVYDKDDNLKEIKRGILSKRIPNH